jgi:hypothetical protein
MESTVSHELKDARREQLRAHRIALVNGQAKYGYSDEKLAYALSLIDAAIVAGDEEYTRLDRANGAHGSDRLGFALLLQVHAGKEACTKLKGMK